MTSVVTIKAPKAFTALQSGLLSPLTHLYSLSPAKGLLETAEAWDVFTGLREINQAPAWNNVLSQWICNVFVLPDEDIAFFTLN